MKSSLLNRAEFVDQQAVGVSFYDSLLKHSTKTNLPFLVTGETFSLWESEKEDIKNLGLALRELYKVASTHYKKPFETFFFRPDILVTEDGFKVCEVETQPFGFALSVFLQNSYREWEDILGMSVEEMLKAFVAFWKNHTGGNKGIFVCSDHTERFRGQLIYLSNLLKKHGGNFSVKTISEVKKSDYKNYFYRAFYSYEKDLDDEVGKFLENKPNIFPRVDEYFEGKYLLAEFFADKKLRKKLTKKTITTLDKLLFPTWFIDEKVPKNFSMDIEKWEDLASLSRAKRRFVVKMAGNHPDASWAKSVMFLHKKSKVQIKQLFKSISKSDHRWIIQPFMGNKKITITYANDNFSDLSLLKGRIRLTPYYEYKTGKLLCMKATIRKNTLLIHASSDSINTIVSDN